MLAIVPGVPMTACIWNAIPLIKLLTKVIHYPQVSAIKFFRYRINWFPFHIANLPQKPLQIKDIDDTR